MNNPTCLCFTLCLRLLLKLFGYQLSVWHQADKPASNLKLGLMWRLGKCFARHQIQYMSQYQLVLVQHEAFEHHPASVNTSNLNISIGWIYYNIWMVRLKSVYAPPTLIDERYGQFTCRWATVNTQKMYISLYITTPYSYHSLYHICCNQLIGQRYGLGQPLEVKAKWMHLNPGQDWECVHPQWF